MKRSRRVLDMKGALAPSSCPMAMCDTSLGLDAHLGGSQPPPSPHGAPNTAPLDADLHMMGCADLPDPQASPTPLPPHTPMYESPSSTSGGFSGAEESVGAVTPLGHVQHEEEQQRQQHNNHALTHAMPPLKSASTSDIPEHGHAHGGSYMAGNERTGSFDCLAQRYAWAEQDQHAQPVSLTPPQTPPGHQYTHPFSFAYPGHSRGLSSPSLHSRVRGDSADGAIFFGTPPTHPHGDLLPPPTLRLDSCDDGMGGCGDGKGPGSDQDGMPQPNEHWNVQQLPLDHPDHRYHGHDTCHAHHVRDARGRQLPIIVPPNHYLHCPLYKEVEPSLVPTQQQQQQQHHHHPDNQIHQYYAHQQQQHQQLQPHRHHNQRPCGATTATTMAACPQPQGDCEYEGGEEEEAPWSCGEIFQYDHDTDEPVPVSGMVTEDVDAHLAAGIETLSVGVFDCDCDMSLT